MKEDQEVYETLARQAPHGYKVNELIRFSYPIRKVRIKALVNKSPDESLVKFYNVLLRSIEKGFNEKNSLFEFLGIPQNDEFVLRELFFLRERGLVDLVTEKWYVTEEGKIFIKDNKILRVEEQEDYEFLMDGVTGKIFPILSHVVKDSCEKKCLERKFNNIPAKSSELLKGRYPELCETYKQDSQNKAYLIDYDENIEYDNNKLWIDYWFVEYIPKKRNDNEPYLEIRNIDSLEKNDFLTKKFNNEYWRYLENFTDSERKEAEVVEEIEQQESRVPSPCSKKNSTIIDLTIWETKQQFISALQNVKEQILIKYKIQ